jgi:hypothetical protein
MEKQIYGERKGYWHTRCHTDDHGHDIACRIMTPDNGAIYAKTEADAIWLCHQLNTLTTQVESLTACCKILDAKVKECSRQPHHEQESDIIYK